MDKELCELQREDKELRRANDLLKSSKVRIDYMSPGGGSKRGNPLSTISPDFISHGQDPSSSGTGPSTKSDRGYRDWRQAVLGR